MPSLRHIPLALAILCRTVGVSALAVAGSVGCLLPSVDAGGRACDVDGACALGFVCSEGACEQVCTSDEDCPVPRRCIVLGAAASGQGACLAGIVDPPDAGFPADGGSIADGGSPEADAGPNLAPGISGATASTHTDVAVSIALAAADDNGDALTIVVERSPAHGTATALGTSVRYQPEPGFAGIDTIAVSADDGALRSGIVEIVVEVIGRSCVHVLNTGGSVGNGPYTIDLTPDDITDADTLVFCDMSSAGGGWTLALKVDGQAPTFCFDDVIWSNDSLLNPDSADETPIDAKLAPYTQLPTSELLVVMDDIENPAAATTSLLIPLDASAANLGLPLVALIAGQDPVDATLAPNEFERLFPGRENVIHDGAPVADGLNVVHSADSAARIGQTGVTTGAFSTLGVGLRGAQCAVPGVDVVSAGLRGEPCCGGQTIQSVPVFARVSVRSRDFTFLPAEPRCQDHLARGRSISGTYLLDPSGPGGDPPQPQACDNGDLRRLIVFDAARGDPCPAPLVDNPAGPGCIRGGSGGAVSLTFPSPVPFTTVQGRVEAIASGHLDGFLASESSSTIDNVYVDGIVISVNEPRQHVFTFAASTIGGTECPCGGADDEPGFVGQRYLCELVADAPAFDADELLFDFEAQDGQCTQPETPNEFRATVGATSGPVEVRIMTDDPPEDEDVALTRLEIFVR